MSNDPEQIRAEIAATRGELSSNVNALTESVKPGNAARRQADRVTGAVAGLKDCVMGGVGRRHVVLRAQPEQRQGRCLGGSGQSTERRPGQPGRRRTHRIWRRPAAGLAAASVQYRTAGGQTLRTRRSP